MSPKIRFILLLAVFFLGIVWWFWADVVKKGPQIREYRKELAEIDNRLEEMIGVTEKGDEVRERYRATVDRFDSLRAVIPDKESYVQVLESIRTLASTQNVEVATLSPIREDSYPAVKLRLKSTDKYVERYPLHVGLYGDFLTIGIFLEELLSMPALINIGSINMETDLNREGTLACRLLLYTYNFVDKKKSRT